MSVPPNRLKFRDAKTPISERFDDIYFADQVGVDESIYVYLEGSGALAAIREGAPEIRIAEVGFGVGLNFLLTLRAFLTESKPKQRLHYTSAEKFPIVKEDLITLYEAYPELLPWAMRFLDQYPVLTPGIHRLQFEGGRVMLDLLIGDAGELFEQGDFTADFWYWDGFAPSKNPDAFSDALFEAVHKRSSPTARGTSFTAAGWVRKSLREHGFTVSKRKGFGKKRECIEAVIAAPHPNAKAAAWFSREKFKTLSQGETVAVIGAGLAGSAIARALAERGYAVEVYDGNGIANRASSNTAALFNVQLSKLPNPISRFSQSALVSFLRELKRLDIPHRMGIFRNDPEAGLCLESSLYPDSFYQHREEGVYFPECGMLHPQVLCEKRLNHSQIKLVLESVSSVEKTSSENSPPKFRILNADQKEIGQASHVVYALGADLALKESGLEHEGVREFPIRAVRGQTLLIKPSLNSSALSEVKVEDGYVSPLAPEVTGHAFHLLGATYQAKEIAPDQEARDTEKLISEAKEKWPEFRALSLEDVVSHKVGYRASTPDKLPLIGPLTSLSFSRENYSDALKGGTLKNLSSLEVREGEWMLMGLGSRGVTFSSLGAEILASLMCGDPLPIEQDLFGHLHPVRFFIRDLKKTTLKNTSA